MELSNTLIYGNRLTCGSGEVANARLNISNVKSFPSWLNEVMIFLLDNISCSKYLSFSVLCLLVCISVSNCLSLIELIGFGPREISNIY